MLGGSGDPQLLLLAPVLAPPLAVRQFDSLTLRSDYAPGAPFGIPHVPTEHPMLFDLCIFALVENCKTVLKFKKDHEESQNVLNANSHRKTT